METTPRDTHTRRSSSRKSLSDAALPVEYLNELEQKRKQLDESIHKYIAQKEREYKQFEKDIKQQHRHAQGQNGANGSAKRRELVQDDVQNAALDGHRSSAVDALLVNSARRDSDSRSVDGEDETSPMTDRSMIANLKDRRASIERDRDFVGLFTPNYLPALEYSNEQQPQRSASAPQVQGAVDAERISESAERANSEPMAQAKQKPPPHLTLSHRTSSSGSSTNDKLASAMKSPNPALPTSRPKRKRVSLAVGDSIVAPSDNVPVALSHHSSKSHSRIRSSVSDREVEAAVVQTGLDEPSINASPAAAEMMVSANAQPVEEQARQQLPPVATSTDKISSPPRSAPKASNIDADGDLFDLEDEMEADMPEGADHDSDSGIESGDEITGRVHDSDEELISGPSEVTYDPEAGLVPEPADGTETAVPYFVPPGSAVASQQPTNPGFRRPSVSHDPQFRGANYKAAERDAVENDVYGSSFNRPSSKGSWAAGSLGESYMAQHAEEMLKLRSARKEAQVRS